MLKVLTVILVLFSLVVNAAPTKPALSGETIIESGAISIHTQDISKLMMSSGKSAQTIQDGKLIELAQQDLKKPACFLSEVLLSPEGYFDGRYEIRFIKKQQDKFRSIKFSLVAGKMDPDLVEIECGSRDRDVTLEDAINQLKGIVVFSGQKKSKNNVSL